MYSAYRKNKSQDGKRKNRAVFTLLYGRKLLFVVYKKNFMYTFQNTCFYISTTHIFENSERTGHLFYEIYQNVGLYDRQQHSDSCWEIMKKNE